MPTRHTLWPHTMDTQDNPWIGDANPVRSDATVDTPQDFHPEDTDDFESIEHVNPTRLAAITRELDDLHQRFQSEEGQLTEHLQCIEWKLQ